MGRECTGDPDRGARLAHAPPFVWCFLAPRTGALYSSGRTASQFASGCAARSPFWDALQTAGAELVLNGDSHAYERFAPQTSTGQSLATGLREFIVGTGGRRHATFGTPLTNSVVRDSTSFGVLQLTLHAAGYSRQFVPIPGDSFADSGSAACR